MLKTIGDNTEAEQLKRLTARANFILNTSHQHTTPAPEWVLRVLRGEDPNAEIE
jgi:hypothetical protein